MPRGAEEQRRSVPFQLLLLLEKMQDSRQKAVRPTELAYCLQKYKIPSKTALRALAPGPVLQRGDGRLREGGKGGAKRDQWSVSEQERR